MNTVDADDIFLDLFQGNRNAVGTETGGCLRAPLIDGEVDGEETYRWWESQVIRHLDGSDPIGVYPVWDGKVKWACIDWDEGDEASWEHALNVHQVLIEFHVWLNIERSRSKGYHGWVFFNDWTDVAPVRKALIVACQIADAPHREVNPKQFELAEGQLGNYVRLPYPWRALHPEGKRNFVGAGFQPLMFEEAMESAWSTRTDSSKLQPLADMWVDEKPITFAPKYIPENTSDAYRRMSGFAAVVFRDGPRDGADRSETLWKLARQLKDDGHHTFEEAVSLVSEADASWGLWHPKGSKFVGRLDGPKQLRALVQKAW